VASCSPACAHIRWQLGTTNKPTQSPHQRQPSIAMYQPPHFDESRPDVLRDLMRQYALSTLITLREGQVQADHIPLLWVDDGTAHGTLVGHVARNNPLWQVTDPGTAVLAVFQGPQAYITPSWYASKKEAGLVVPTWNYAVVHVQGRLRTHEDPAWIRHQLEQLTREHEATQHEPWALADAPPAFIDRLMGAIVGIEIPIERITGKWKVSQNQAAANRAGVVQGLSTHPPGSAECAMADLVARQHP
jgi:transcriptional regulator